MLDTCSACAPSRPVRRQWTDGSTSPRRIAAWPNEAIPVRRPSDFARHTPTVSAFLKAGSWTRLNQPRTVQNRFHEIVRTTARRRGFSLCPTLPFRISASMVQDSALTTRSSSRVRGHYYIALFTVRIERRMCGALRRPNEILNRSRAWTLQRRTAQTNSRRDVRRASGPPITTRSSFRFLHASLHNTALFPEPVRSS
jgi:hypothetical protein